MKALLSFSEILKVGEPQIAEMERLGRQCAGADAAEAYAAFQRQVLRVEGVVKQTYGVAATSARKADDLGEVAEIWNGMSRFCQNALQTLTALTDRYPDCVAPGLYDLVLDYKLAADQRNRNALEEMACQTIDLPRGLLPELK